MPRGSSKPSYHFGRRKRYRDRKRNIEKLIDITVIKDRKRYSDRKQREKHRISNRNKNNKRKI